MRPMHVAYRASVYTIPMKILTGTIKAFPKAKIYILNSSMDQLESIHSNICKELQEHRDQKYDILDKLCYFTDFRRAEECFAEFELDGLHVRQLRMDLGKEEIESLYNSTKKND